MYEINNIKLTDLKRIEKNNYKRIIKNWYNKFNLNKNIGSNEINDIEIEKMYLINNSELLLVLDNFLLDHNYAYARFLYNYI